MLRSIAARGRRIQFYKHGRAAMLLSMRAGQDGDSNLLALAGGRSCLCRRSRRLVGQRLLRLLDDRHRRGIDFLGQRLQFLARDRIDDQPDLLRLGQQLRGPHRRHERLAQRRDPVRRHAGRQHVRAAERRRAVDQFHHPAVLRRLGEVDGERHAQLVDVRVALVVLLDEHADEAGFDPVRTLRLEARPAEAAQPLDLALLDGERDLAGARIAADQANLGAGHVVEHGRKVARRGAGLTGADDQLLGEQVLERFHRRVGAGDTDVMIDRGGAEMDEFGRVVSQPPGVAEQRVEQRVENDGVLQRADHRAVLGCDIIDMRGGGVAGGARHVAHHHGGIAGDMLGQMPGDEPRIDVVAAAGGGADDHVDLPAFEELRGRVLGRRRCDRSHGERNGQQQAAPHHVLPRIRRLRQPATLREPVGQSTTLRAPTQKPALITRATTNTKTPNRRRDSMRPKHAILLALLASAAVVDGVSPAAAQSWPTRAVTMVVPFAAGGGTDVLGRIVGRRLSELLGQQVIIENVGGAGGMMGSARVVRAPPDGYQFVIGSRADAINQTLYKNPLYNFATDLAPVVLIAEQPTLLVTRKDFPAGNLQEFIAHAKANQSSLQMGSAGAGSTGHLDCTLLNDAIGIKVTHIPYRGGGPAMQDLIAGRIDYICTLSATAKPQIESNLIKPIAILTRDRSSMLPNLASAHQQGLTDFEATTWFGFFLPSRTPASIVQRLHDATVAAMDTPSVQERLKEVGATVVAPGRRSPEYLQGFVESEIKKNAVPIKATGISMD